MIVRDYKGGVFTSRLGCRNVCNVPSEISRTNERLVWRSTCRGVVVSKGSRREHGMDQLDQGFDGEWFLEKRYLIRADSIGFAVLCRQARHQDHAERSLHSQGPLDDFMTMDSWIRISG